VAVELGKLTVGLQAESGVKLKGLGGEALHALFFRILRQNSSELASKMHNQKEQRPFSLTPPLRDCELRQGYTIVFPRTTLTFDLAFLTEELLNTSVSAFLSVLQEERVLSLSRKPVILQSLDFCEGSFSSFPKVLSGASLSPLIALEFVTPTSFRKNEMQVTFPQPELVFSSLLKRWNAFSELKLSKEHIARFASIKVSSYELHTELVHFSKYKIIGFKGKVEYELPKNAPDDFLRAVNALADFASYPGVGTKTAMGMGQVRRVS
jgi:CRISPR-associated endoribonuclease Cas6